MVRPGFLPPCAAAVCCSASYHAHQNVWDTCACVLAAQRGQLLLPPTPSYAALAGTQAAQLRRAFAAARCCTAGYGTRVYYVDQIYLSSCNTPSGSPAPTFPPELRVLTRINFIAWSTSNLVGSIPAEYSELTALNSLQLFNNQLTGEQHVCAYLRMHTKAGWMGATSVSVGISPSGAACGQLDAASFVRDRRW